MIGLLAATGMRVGEAIALDRDDLHREQQALLVRRGKFGKARELALHPSTLEALARYLRRHDRPPAAAASAALFVSSTGSRLAYADVQRTFQRLAASAGLAPRSANCRPRLHDYADLRVMPTSPETACSAGVQGLKLSA